MGSSQDTCCCRGSVQSTEGVGRAGEVEVGRGNMWIARLMTMTMLVIVAMVMVDDDADTGSETIGSADANSIVDAITYLPILALMLVVQTPAMTFTV